MGERMLGRTALVTGSTDGIGVGIARTLAAHGAQVVVSGRNAARGRGAIVNIGSINGLVGMAGSALYSATKATIHSLTKSWAAEYGPRGVRVNTVAPGPTRTRRNEEIAEHLGPIIARAPSRRLSTTDEVGEAVLYLASDAASNVHAATLSVDGGWAAV
jgi:NAD(P)-dependent dehydrogenase (short-subunit alcohol dehydrogenase family)